MPYIREERKPGLYPRIAEVAQNEGELNYQMTVLLDRYMCEHGLSYSRMGDCTAACENAAAEFRRRVMSIYEDLKISENGDVYSCLALMPDPPF